MSQATQTYQPREIVIVSASGKGFDITNSVLAVDYFENILESSVTAILTVSNAYSLVSQLPIRGGEKVYLDIATGSGDFTLNDEKKVLYVYKVSGIDSERMAENSNIHLVSREFLTNETSRCEKKYTGKISGTVKNILKEKLLTDKFEDKNIEETSNSYAFIGNMKKPFHTLQWLCPKSISKSAGELDPSGEKATEQGLSKGTSGFLFYENAEGFNFRSIDSLVSKKRIQNSEANDETIFTYSYTGKVIESNNPQNNFKILNFVVDKNIDLRKALRVGTYSNKTYFYNTNTHEISIYSYHLSEQIKDKKLGTQDKIDVPKGFEKAYSRVLVRTSDHGIMSAAGGTATTGRDISDMAKSYARYNLLFSQALNILIPCNVKLKVGDIIKCEFQSLEAGSPKEVDSESSGYYVIRELRHHFSPQQNTTSLKLMRDSYGLY